MDGIDIDQISAQANVHPMDGQVLGKPFVWWSEKHTEENKSYLVNLSTSYVRYKIDLIKARVSGKSCSELDIIFIRQLHSETLELAFALSLSLIEQPNATAVWLRKYSTLGLRIAAKQILRGEYNYHRAGETNCDFHRAFDIALFKLFSTFRVQNRAGIGDAYARMFFNLKLALQDFCDDNLYEEYNSIKHSHRAHGTEGIEVRFALMNDGSVERPQNSEFHTLIKSDLSVNYHRVDEIRIKNKVPEVGLEEVSTSLRGIPILNRIELLCEAIDVIISALWLEAEIRFEATLKFPDISQLKQAYGVGSSEGRVIKRYTYELSKNRNIRTWGYGLDIFLNRTISEHPFSLGFASIS